MINGKAKLEFGTGDIRMTGCFSHDTGALCMITQEPHEIGSKAPVHDTWSVNEAQVIMTFTKTESIDALIAELQDVKKFMNGEFPEDGRMTHDKKFDFDAFMNDKNN